MGISLNALKSGRSWAPYSPFTLSIKSQDALYRFIQGSLYILVLVDLEEICAIAARVGFIASINTDDDTYPLALTRQGGDGDMKISQQFLSRVGFEFTSPTWIINASIDVFRRNLERTAEEVQVL